MTVIPNNSLLISKYFMHNLLLKHIVKFWRCRNMWYSCFVNAHIKFVKILQTNKFKTKEHFIKESTLNSSKTTGVVMKLDEIYQGKYRKHK